MRWDAKHWKIDDFCSLVWGKHYNHLINISFYTAWLVMLGAWFHVCWILITRRLVKSYTHTGAEETCQEEVVETTCDTDGPKTRDTSNVTRYVAVVKHDEGIKELQRFGFAPTLRTCFDNDLMSKVARFLHCFLLMISHVFKRSKEVGPWSILSLSLSLLSSCRMIIHSQEL